jgi:hypothetical protein
MAGGPLSIVAFYLYAEAQRRVWLKDAGICPRNIIFSSRRIIVKKLSLVCILGVILAGGAVMAQDAGSSETFQFVNFNFGVMAGLSLADSPNDGLVGAVNFGVDFAVFDKLQVGIDVFQGAANVNFRGLHLGYAISPTLVAGIGIGAGDDGTAVTLGIGYNIFGGKSERGIFHALKLRADYIISDLDDFAKGVIGITLGASFGA